MGATHPNFGSDYSRGTLGYNSLTKKHGGFKRQVRCFLLDRGYKDDLKLQNAIIQQFGASMKQPAPSCKTIVEKHWIEFKSFVDNLNT